ncbi:MAG: RNA polymerase sigma factor [Opitutus sp.]
MNTPGMQEPLQVADQTRWFAEEVHAHEASLKAYLHGTFPRIRDVDDVVQESYLRTWRRHTARRIESAKSFLFTVARNLALEILRREGRSPICEVVDLDAIVVIDDKPCAAEMACSREEIALLFAAISSLSARTREVYLLRKFEGLSQKRIAARLGISPNTVEVHVGRANRYCEEFLRKRGILHASKS